jgi:hypothetical protein
MRRCRRIRGSSTEVELASAGVPLPRPLPARSSRRGEGVAAGIQTSSNGIALRPRPPPSPGLSPPELQGGEESFDALRTDWAAPDGVPLPRPLPARSSRRGESVRLGARFIERHRTASAAAPPLPASPPRTAGGRGELRCAADGLGCARRSPPPPAPPPRVPRGEGRIRSRHGRCVAPSRATPPVAHRTSPPPHPPQFGGGVDRRREERAKGWSGERARPERPTSIPTSRHMHPPPARGRGCEAAGAVPL